MRVLASFIFTFLFCAVIQCVNFFILVLEWPGALCTINHCCYSSTPASNFTLHGLWPVHANGTLAENCTSSDTYNATELSDLMPELHSKWESLTCPQSNGDDFWKHEWETHGTCAFQSAHDYFNRTLELRNAVNPLGFLLAAGITPNGSSYTIQSVMHALRASGRSVGIECGSTTGNGSLPQLYQLYFCVDPAAEVFIDCPPLSVHCNNSSRVQFSKFP